MLSPVQRIKAVAILATNAVQDLQAHSFYDPNTNLNVTDLHKAFEVGFPGFASYSDQDLIQSLHKIRNTNYPAKQLLESLAEDFLLK